MAARKRCAPQPSSAQPPPTAQRRTTRRLSPSLASHRAALLREKAAEQAPAAGARRPPDRRARAAISSDQAAPPPAQELTLSRWCCTSCSARSPRSRSARASCATCSPTRSWCARAHLTAVRTSGARQRSSAWPARPPAAASATPPPTLCPSPLPACLCAQVPASAVPTLQSNLADVCWFMGLENLAPPREPRAAARRPPGGAPHGALRNQPYGAWVHCDHLLEPYKLYGARD